MAGLPFEFDYLSRHRSFRELGELARRAYSGPPRTTTVDEAIWRAFPRGYVGGWIDGTLRGCIQLWPLDAQRAGDFLIGARSERDLTEDDLATLCNSVRTVWYFSALLLDPTMTFDRVDDETLAIDRTKSVDLRSYDPATYGSVDPEGVPGRLVIRLTLRGNGS